MTQYGPTVDLLQAADILKVHPKTVQDYIAAGALPAAKVGRAWVMLTRDVVDLVEQMITRQTAERLRGRATRGAPRGPTRGGSRTASSSGGCGAR